MEHYTTVTKEERTLKERAAGLRAELRPRRGAADSLICMCNPGAYRLTPPAIGSPLTVLTLIPPSNQHKSLNSSFVVLEHLFGPKLAHNSRNSLESRRYPLLSSPTTQYRPDVDGVRAIAVMLVLHFHAFPEAIPGGFIGVDVFFVISGFLITGIIARELEQKRFSLSHFYVRRIRRIFPALIVMLGAVLLLGWFWMLPADYARLGGDVFASAAFSANIALLLQSGYFDVESAKKPLLHLWSLGIEEQFYLFWPLLLMVAVRIRMSMLALALTLGIASFVLNVALMGANPVATFYLPFTRAFELLTGAALARGWGRISQTGAASNGRAVTGLTLIALAACLLDTHSAFPGWWAILPVAGSALVLSAPGAWLCRVVLASPPMVWIGLISYPLYLWHWPLLVFFAIIKFNPLTLLERELILLASMLLAWATYQYVEKPFRFGRPSPRKLFALCAAAILMAVAGGAVVWDRGFDFRLPAEIRAMADVPTQSWNWRFHQCLLDLSREVSFADDCVDPGRRPLVVVWGDFDRRRAAARVAQGPRKQEFWHRAIHVLFLHSCLTCECIGRPKLPRD